MNVGNLVGRIKPTGSNDVPSKFGPLFFKLNFTEFFLCRFSWIILPSSFSQNRHQHRGDRRGRRQSSRHRGDRRHKGIRSRRGSRKQSAAPSPSRGVQKTRREIVAEKLAKNLGIEY